MPNRHSRGHRDTNEPEITEVLRRYGLPHFLLPEGMGADILVLTSPMMLIEVKNPNRPPSARKLTECEQETADYCAENGIPYHIVQTAEEMVEIVASKVEEGKI